MTITNKLLIGFILAVVIYFAGDFIYGRIHKAGYDAGVAYQTQVYQTAQAKAKQEFDVLQAQADKERSDLNKQIQSLSDQNKALKEDLAKKKKEIQQEKTDYAKTTGGSMSCFGPNDDGLFIINKSFPSAH